MMGPPEGGRGAVDDVTATGARCLTTGGLRDARAPRRLAPALAALPLVTERYSDPGGSFAPAGGTSEFP